MLARCNAGLIYAGLIYLGRIQCWLEADVLLEVPYFHEASSKHSLHGNIHERAIAIGNRLQSNESIEDERVPSIGQFL